MQDPKKRVCLWCDKKFLSSWAGERKCPECRLRRGPEDWGTYVEMDVSGTPKDLR